MFWEVKGRDAVLMEEVIVAREDIRAGAKMESHMFITVGIPRENKLEESLTSKDIDQIKGKVSSQLILKNNQISLRYFRQDDFYLNEGESIFVIEPHWIAMRSSSLRRGDVVDIYGADGRGIIGTFQVAFVKDNSEREVRDAGEAGQVKVENLLLERTDSTSVIDHIEIISTLNQYEELLACVTGDIPTSLIIVQKGEKIDK